MLASNVSRSITAQTTPLAGALRPASIIPMYDGARILPRVGWNCMPVGPFRQRWRACPHIRSGSGQTDILQFIKVFDDLVQTPHTVGKTDVFTLLHVNLQTQKGLGTSVALPKRLASFMYQLLKPISSTYTVNFDLSTYKTRQNTKGSRESTCWSMYSLKRFISF